MSADAIQARFYPQDIRGYLVLLIGMFTGIASASVRLPALVGSGMVLQRDARLVIWGWADPGERITLDFHGAQVATKVSTQGKWSTSLGPFPAGGPYEMTVKGKNTLVLHDILIGDVWLASGQSNMKFPLKGTGDWENQRINNADREVATATFPRIRLFKVPQRIALHPAQDVAADAWVAVTPESVANFSAVAYLFGREIHQRYRVPIGLIEAAWGGTLAEAWMSDTGLTPFPEFHKSIRALRQVNEKAAAAEHLRYVEQKTQWDRHHAANDRGQIEGRAVWADPAFDATAWPKIVVPQKKPEEALKGFDGAVWFRTEFVLSGDDAGNTLQVHLTGVSPTDTAYFNGEKIGETTDAWNARDYFVPARLVKAGRNVIVIRIIGRNGHVGLFDFDNPEKLNVEIGARRIPLAGTWSYQAGPDLTDLPEPSAQARLIGDQNGATVLFNAMIHPLARLRIKGVIWYQGESNALDHRSAQYRKLFPALIRDWRKHWGYEFPFLFVQLAGVGQNKAEPAEYSWAELREAQSMALALTNTGMATAVDIGDEGIHPPNKQEVAHRLALAAAKVAYGEDIIYSGPVYHSMKVEGGRIRIQFRSLGSGLSIEDKYGYVRGFEIAGSDGKFFWAQARQDGQEIVVSSEAVPNPIAVRYDWSNRPDGNVFNKDGLPALPFRTDAPKD